MLVVFVALLGLIGLGFWIPVAISVVSIGLLYYKFGMIGFKSIGLIVWGGLSNFSLTPIALFIFMAELLLVSGIASRLYRGLSLFTRRLPGGLLQTNMMGCAFFSAICGSSVATAAAIGAVAMPEMRLRNYPLNYSAASLAAGGTLGILIPPSIAFILYAGLTEASIAQLFAAGLIPGVTLMAMFCVYIAITAPLRLGTRQIAKIESVDWRSAAWDVLPVTILVAAVLGSIYLGIATPTEAAALGCVIALLLCVNYRTLNLKMLLDAALRTVAASSSILFIVAAALLFSYSAAATNFTGQIAGLVTEVDLGKYGFLLLVGLLFIVLGCFVDSISLMLIVIPIVAPLLPIYEIDPVWFGVFAVVLIEVGLITPPVGLNLFVIAGIAKLPVAHIILDVLPYIALLIGLLILTVVFPGLVLWFPSLLTQ